MVAGYADTVHRHLVDAFVLVDTHPGDPRPAWLTERSIPWAAFGRIWNDETDDHLGRRGRAGRHGGGRRPPRRRAATSASATSAGRPARPSATTGTRGGQRRPPATASTTAPVAVCEQGIGEATAAAGPLLDAVGRGGAVVCASDALAIGVLHAALARGWHVGPDLGLVGFDGSSAGQMCGLTTLVQPLERIADHCLTLVHDLLAGAAPPQSGALFQPRPPRRSLDRSQQERQPMKHRTHALAALGLTTAMILAACGGDDDDDSGGTDAPAGTEAAGDTAAPATGDATTAEPSGDGTALTMLIASSGDAETNSVKAAAAAWAAESGNSVEVLVATDMNQELAQGFAVGQPARHLLPRRLPLRRQRQGRQPLRLHGRGQRRLLRVVAPDVHVRRHAVLRAEGLLDARPADQQRRRGRRPA